MNDQELNNPFVFYSDKLNYKTQIGTKGKEYYIEGHISTGDLDLVNDIVTKACMDDMTTQFDSRTIKLDFEHETFRGKSQIEAESNKTRIPLGKAYTKGRDSKGVKVKWKMNKNWKKFDQKGNVVMDFNDIWSNVEDGFYDAFSIAYVPTKTANIQREGKSIRLLDKVHLLNVALTGNAINPNATMTSVMAKSLEFMKSVEEEESEMENIEIKSSLKKLENDIEELKTKYKKRWRGRDGKWRYEYAEGQGPKKQGTPRDTENEQEIRENLESARDDAQELALDGLSESQISANLQKNRGLTKKQADEIAADSSDVRSRGGSAEAREGPKESEKEREKFWNEVEKRRESINKSKEAYSKMASARLNVSDEQKKKIDKAMDLFGETIDQAEKDLQKFSKDSKPIESTKSISSNTDKMHRGAKQMVDKKDDKPAEEAEAPKEEVTEQPAEEAKETEAEAPVTEGKSDAMAEMKSHVAQLEKQISELKAILEKPIQKSLGAENKEEVKGKTTEAKSFGGPMDIIA